MAEHEVEQLHALNALFALSTGTNRDVAAQIQSAINFTLEDAQPGGPDMDSLGLAAKRLLEMHTFHKSHSYGFYHCDLRHEENDPLWLREHVLKAIRHLVGYPHAILLVTGLRRMVCPPGKRWTPARQQDYANGIRYIEELTAQGITASTRLHMLFL